MAERSDITVDWGKSPRIAEVALPSTELAAQDLHDTFKSDTLQASEADDSLDNMDDDPLIDSAGKESLGGGTNVGITSTLENTQIAFGRTAPITSGTVTTASALFLTDSSATFITDGVERGDWVINWTDKCVTEIVQVDSETVLECRPLSGGTNDTFSLNDEYTVWDVEEAQLLGGNIVALDDADQEINPLFTSFGRFCTRTSAASATLQEQADIEYSSFGGGVTVDVLSSFTGTGFPNGTPRAPVNNMADALLIANERGFKKFFIIGDITLNDSAIDLSSKQFVGESITSTQITIDPAAVVNDCVYEFATVTGTLDGESTIRSSNIVSLNVINGIVRECGIEAGTITLGGGKLAEFLDCISVVAGSSTPIIDMGGSGQPMLMRRYSGGVKLINKSGADPVSIDLSGGQIILDDTVTNGEIVMRGTGTWTNRETYAGGADIKNQLIDGNLVQLLDRSAYSERVTVDTVSGQSGTVFPIGSPKFPVDNLTDAIVISTALSVTELFLRNSQTVPVGPDFGACAFKGYSASTTQLTIPTGATVNGSLYTDLIVTGDTGGGTGTIERCQVLNLDNYNGFMLSTALIGGFTVTLGGNASTVMLDCWGIDDVNGDGPCIDMNGSGQDLQLRNFAGDVIIKNLSGASNLASVEMAGGGVTLDSATMTGGTVYLRGVGDWLNRETYTGTTTVIDELTDGKEIKDLWTHAGLDADAPITVTPTGVDSLGGRIDINITGDGVNSNTFTRQ